MIVINMSQSYRLYPLAVVLSIILVIYFIFTKTREALFGPLSKVPGPAITKWTNLPLKLAVLTGKRMYYIHNLHQKHGSIVRISPDELSFSDLSAVKDIYKVHGGFRKSSWYRRLIQVSEPNIFTMTDPKDHAERRRLFAQSFSSSWIKKVEGQVRDKVDLAISGMKREIKDQGSTDLLKWWTFLTTDVTGELSFGESFHMLELGKVCYDQTIECSTDRSLPSMNHKIHRADTTKTEKHIHPGS